MTLEELSVVFTADIQPFTQAVYALQGLVSSAVQTADAMAGAFMQAGHQAAAGLESGLLAGRSRVANAAATLAAAASDAVRSALKIHSPSQVTREMGQMFDEGFLQGMMENMPRLEKEAQSLGSRTEAALSTAVEGPASRNMGAADGVPSPVHVTVPLEIDGYRLGVAVIENLNRITNATGRVELQL